MAKDDWLAQQVATATTEPKAPIPTNCDSSSVEQWLQKFGVKYSRLLDLPLVKIDERRSRANQARQTALVDDSVQRYTADLRKGDKFPPVVGYQVGTGPTAKVVLIDGNNRDAAHRKAGVPFIKAYVLSPDTPSETVHAMTVDANSHHGVTPPLAWRLQQAEHLVTLGFSPDEACGYASVTRSQLGDHQRVVRGEIRAKALKVSGFGELPAYHKAKLSLIQSDPVFLQVSRLAIDTSMTVAELNELTRELKACTSEHAMQQVVGRVSMDRKAAAKAREAVGARRGVSSPTQSLVSAIGKIMHVDPATLNRMLLTDLDRTEMQRQLAQVADRILELQIALEVTVSREGVA